MWMCEGEAHKKVSKHGCSIYIEAATVVLHAQSMTEQKVFKELHLAVTPNVLNSSKYLYQPQIEGSDYWSHSALY